MFNFVIVIVRRIGAIWVSTAVIVVVVVLVTVIVRRISAIGIPAVVVVVVVVTIIVVLLGAIGVGTTRISATGVFALLNSLHSCGTLS